MQLKAQTERRFGKRNKFYRQNKIFQTDAKTLYRELRKNQVMIKETLLKSSVKGYGEKKLVICLQAG